MDEQNGYYMSIYSGEQIDEAVGNVQNKVSKVVPAAAGNLATLSATGDLQDSGLLPSQAGVRKNLLDNWYFVGGGTTGKFPINQRAITDYTNEGYNVDRWICNEAGVSAVENGISIPAGVYFFQRLPGNLLAGKTVTMSVLFADGDLVSGTGIVSTSGIVNIYPLNNNVRLYSENNSGTNFIAFVVYVGTARTISAIKLELGETQTLARQTDSGWELLEIPDYGTELAKCQRYYVPVGGSLGLVIGGAHFSNLQIAAVDIPVPVTMRAKPVITDIVNLGTLFYGNSTKSVERLTVDQVHAGSVRVFYGQTGITENCPCAFDSMKFAFSSDL